MNFQPKQIKIPLDPFDEWNQKRKELRRMFKTGNIPLSDYIIAMVMLAEDSASDLDKIKYIKEYWKFLNTFKDGKN